MSDILVNEIFRIENPNQYKLHLACRNTEGVNPLDRYIEGRENWIGWNEWRGNRDDWTREYIFSLIEFYPKSNFWLFGGIFRVLERHPDRYVLSEVDDFNRYDGRLLLSFVRYQGMRGRAFYLDRYLDQLIVSEIFPKPYDGEVFPGYQNINHDFSALEFIFKSEKSDWKTALMNIKGVYLLTDKLNGKQYVGSAYGEAGIWSRWSCYIGTGHGWNDQLTKLINDKGIAYSRKNFKLSILETMLFNTPDVQVIDRESYWKRVLMTKEFGYNSN